MEQKINIVEDLMKPRQPFPDNDVIYICQPSQESINAILNDFSNPSKPKYKNIYLFTLGSVKNSVFETLKSSPHFIRRLQEFKEITLDFLALESHIFHFDNPNFPLIANASNEAANEIGGKLANLCITLEEMPFIRYQRSSEFAPMIAASLSAHLSRFNYSANGEGKDSREKAQILILDRSFDPISPLMHDYTYQAMVHDLLNVQDGVISYKASNNKGEVETKQAILNENDQLWTELRHQHIAKVIELIKEKMNILISNSSGLAKRDGDNSTMSISEMAAAVKKLPEYTQSMSKLSQHVSLAQDCMNIFGTQNLMELSQIEQTISTGFDEDGREIKGQRLFQLVREKLSTLTNPELVKRLIAIYLCSQPSHEYASQIFNGTNFSESDFQKLKLLCASFSAVSGLTNAEERKSMFSFLGSGKKAPNQNTNNEEYADTRHVCLLKTYIEQLLSDSLSIDSFPYEGAAASSHVNNTSNAKSVRKFGANHKFNKKEPLNYVGGRVIVFVVGGLCYNELKTAYEIIAKEQREIILGSTSIMTPKEYLAKVTK